MSRMGNIPVDLVGGANVEIKDGTVTIAGPKGDLSYVLPDCVNVREEASRLWIESPGETAEQKALHGTARSLIQGMVTGVVEGYRRELEIQGVGYRGKCTGQQLTLNLGLSSPVEYVVPEGVSVSMPDATHIVLESIDKALVGQTAATIRRFRPPDSYKGKGIRYAGEHITLKEGKTVA